MYIILYGINNLSFHRPCSRLFTPNHRKDVLEKLLLKLEQSFAKLDLPRSREEFISRTSLFHLFQEIKRYYRRMQKMPEDLLNRPLHK
ncbi:MAG: hypothetical protein SCJ94_12005 [Bacillota bacterium]|nr:hypothetical protein [Bacillota bacterium]